MKIFKFGGASVKEADAVRNVAQVLRSQGFDSCLLVVSAMGKTTNALEGVMEAYFAKGDFQAHIEAIKQQHLIITNGLFAPGHKVFAEVDLFFNDITAFLRRNKSPNFSFVYDQVVGCGEMIASKILSEFLNDSGFPNQWLDARDFIKTDAAYRDGQVNWQETAALMSGLDTANSYVTQGFLGSDPNNFTVTLGREGSDYSAAIFAFCLNATAVTIWKDVPGVMTGDPRKFDDVQLLPEISYEEAIEMAYYGASVIHPKTLQPLKQKNIPFYVKSFLQPDALGTKVGPDGGAAPVEAYILKENQVLLRISTRDFSFIAEEHLSQIFSALAAHKIKVSLMQNSAISLALCVEDKFKTMDDLVADLQEDFNTEVTKNTALFTVRNINPEDIARFYLGKNILLEQVSQRTLQMVTN